MSRSGEGLVIGNLTHDANTVMLENEREITTFTVAKNKQRKNPETNQWEDLKPDYYDVIAFGTLGNRSANLKKGDRVVVFYTQSQSHYETSDGKKIPTWSFIAKDIEKTSILPKATFISRFENNMSVEGYTNEG